MGSCLLQFFACVSIMIIPNIISNPNTPLWAKLVVALTSLLKIYPICGFILLISLTWMVSELLKIFGKRISNCHHETQTIRKHNKDTSKNMLDEWKRHYLLIDRLVEELNCSFGFIILILVSSTFVRIINSLFKLMSSFNQGGGFFIQIFFLLIDCMSLALMAYASYRVPHEVSFNNAIVAF